MATRSEQYHADAQRTGAAKAKKAKKAKGSKPGVPKALRSRAKKHAGKKATYALEETKNPKARPARKSTRKSANRSKADAGLTGREQLRQGTPESKYAKTRDGAAKVRGSRASGGPGRKP